MTVYPSQTGPGAPRKLRRWKRVKKQQSRRFDLSLGNLYLHLHSQTTCVVTGKAVLGPLWSAEVPEVSTPLAVIPQAL